MKESQANANITSNIETSGECWCLVGHATEIEIFKINLKSSIQRQLNYSLLDNAIKRLKRNRNLSVLRPKTCKIKLS